MILREIPRELEAVLFDGTNLEEIRKFGGRHGEHIEFGKDEHGAICAMVHTAQGTEKIAAGVWVVADAQDQLARIFPGDIGTRYEVVDPNADRIAVPDPVIPPEPKVIDPEHEGDDDDFEYDEADYEESPSGIVVPATLGPKAAARLKPKPAQNARIDAVEAKLDKLIGLLSE